MLSIERQFVRTERPLYSHLVSLLETAIAVGLLALPCAGSYAWFLWREDGRGSQTG